MSPTLEMALRLLLATALGAAIGYERERFGKVAGIRTHIIITMGAALYNIISIYGYEGNAFDASRIGAGVVAGIGFIGAGVIFRDIRNNGVAGITSAACIWISAAVGLAAGSGMYLLSVLATFITVIVLLLPKAR